MWMGHTLPCSSVPSKKQKLYHGNMSTAMISSKLSKKLFWSSPSIPANSTWLELAQGWWSHGNLPKQLQCHPNPAGWPLDQHHLPGLYPWATGCHHCWHCTGHDVPHSLSHIYISAFPIYISTNHLMDLTVHSMPSIRHTPHNPDKSHLPC